MNIFIIKLITIYLYITQIDIGDLDFQYFQSHAREKEKSSVCPSPLLVCFTRGQQSMSKDLIINFRIAVESDGATSGLQKGITFSLKLDKLTSTSNTRSFIATYYKLSNRLCFISINVYTLKYIHTSP